MSGYQPIIGNLFVCHKWCHLTVNEQYIQSSQVYKSIPEVILTVLSFVMKMSRLHFVFVLRGLVASSDHAEDG